MPLSSLPFLQVDDLTVSFRSRSGGSVRALSGASLSLQRGDSCAVLGPSGCGKTTLLYAIAGLVKPEGGLLLVADEPVRARRPGTAMILQDYGLLPWKRVSENVALGLRFRGHKRSESASRVDLILEQVGLQGLGSRYPHQLSGGQQQRVAIARALVLEPDLLLMDEPFAALDAINRESLQDLVIDLWKGYGLTIVFVTHSIEEACFLGQQVAVLTPSPATVHDIFHNPHAGDRRFREEPVFYERCARLRKTLETVMHGEHSVAEEATL